MKNLTIIVISCLMILPGLSAQEMTLADVAEKNKEMLAAQGYEFIEGKINLTNKNYMLGLDNEILDSGYYYATIVIIEACPVCEVKLNFYNHTEGKEYDFPVKMKTSGKFSGSTYEFRQTIDDRVTMHAYVNADIQYYTSILLFRKPY